MESGSFQNQRTKPFGFGCRGLSYSDIANQQPMEPRNLGLKLNGSWKLEPRLKTTRKVAKIVTIRCKYQL